MRRRKEARMAGLNAVANSTKATTGTNAKTVIRITAPANQGVRVKKFGITFSGTSSTAAPIDIAIVVGGSGGSGTSVTPRKTSGHSGSVQSAAAGHYASEPTSYTTIKTYAIHPQRGIEAPLDNVLAGGESLGVVVTAASAVDCQGFIEFEE